MTPTIPPEPETGSGVRVPWLRRVLAWAALGFAALLAVAVVSLVARNLGSLLVVLVGLALAVAGGWWAITERMPRRVVGIAGLIGGLVVMVVTVIGSTATSEQPLAIARGVDPLDDDDQ